MNKWIMILSLILGCGFPDSNTDEKNFLRIKPILDRNCAECHQFTLLNFKSSSSGKMIRDGTMPPPPAVMSSEDKDALLTYLFW